MNRDAAAHSGAGNRAIVFDMDGVLIDSEPLWRRAEIEIFAHVGLELTEADCLETTGLRIDEAVGYWHARHPWSGPSIPELADRIVARMEALIAHEGEPLPHVSSALEHAGQNRWRLGLASSSPMRLIEAVLARFDMRDRFEALRSAETEAKGKPHPDVYLSALRGLNVPARKSIAIEDSANGLRSALDAGMLCVAIPEPDQRYDPRFAEATWRLDSLADFPSLLDRIDSGEETAWRNRA